MDAVRLTLPFRFIIVGSPDYLRERKRPERPERFAPIRMLEIATIQRGARAMVAQRQRPRDRDRRIGTLIANDFPTMLGAAVEGVGLAQVPEPIAADALTAGKLVHVLEPFAPMAPGVFLYYPGHRQMMPKLRAFIDHVKSPLGRRQQNPNSH
jgi:DNA-binding transcriptional LysR family regulator